MSKHFQSLFPDVPRENPAIDKDSHFTPLWELFFGAMSQALQENFKNEGVVFPALSNADKNTIQNLYASYVGGTYNALTNKLPDISGQTIYCDDEFNSFQFVIATDNANPANVTLAQWVPLSVMLTNPGNPNGNVAGVINWLCYDSTNKILYICTASGNKAIATWQNI